MSSAMAKCSDKRAMRTSDRQAKKGSGKAAGTAMSMETASEPQKSSLREAEKKDNVSIKNQEFGLTEKILNIKGDPNMLMKTKTRILTKSVKPICV